MDKGPCPKVPFLAAEEGVSFTSEENVQFFLKICASVEPVPSETNNTTNQMVRQGPTNQVGPSHMIRPSPSLEQLISQYAASQMLQQTIRF